MNNEVFPVCKSNHVPSLLECGHGTLCMIIWNWFQIASLCIFPSHLQQLGHIHNGSVFLWSPAVLIWPMNEFIGVSLCCCREKLNKSCDELSVYKIWNNKPRSQEARSFTDMLIVRLIAQIQLFSSLFWILSKCTSEGKWVRYKEHLCSESTFEEKRLHFVHLLDCAQGYFEF